MFFKKKKKTIECEECGSKIEVKYSFCPYCGASMYEEEYENPEDFGMLGREDIGESMEESQFPSMGITDKILGSLVNNLVRTLSKEMKGVEKTENAEIKSFPNGIRIRIGPGVSQKVEGKSNQKSTSKELSAKQIKKMSELPRTTAKTNVKRLTDKIVYELAATGVKSKEDIFISKLESGYEIKAIGTKKVYVNTIPLNLPIRNLSLTDKKLLLEFPVDQK